MDYQKIINLLDNTPNQTFKFKTKNRVERKRVTPIVKLNLTFQGQSLVYAIIVMYIYLRVEQ